MFQYFYQQLKKSFFFRNIIELRRLVFAKRGEYTNYLSQEIYKNLIQYCAQSLKTNESEIKTVYLLYTGLVSPEIAQYFNKVNTIDTYELIIGENIGVFEVKFNDSIYVFCESISYNYSHKKRGFFHKVLSLPPFTIYELDWKEQLEIA